MAKFLDTLSRSWQTMVAAVKNKIRQLSVAFRQRSSLKQQKTTRANVKPESAIDTINRLIKQQKQKNKRFRPIRRRSRQRVYRLQGYTTVSKIKKRRQSEQNQHLLRELLLVLIILILVIVLYYKFNPFHDMQEWYRIIGIDSLKDLDIQTTTGVINP